MFICVFDEEGFGRGDFIVLLGEFVGDEDEVVVVVVVGGEEVV